MLLKPGYRGVYVSRGFAIKNGLVPKQVSYLRLYLFRTQADTQFSMGGAGYTGLKSIGEVPITVAGKTQKHNALVSEHEHFDVVLGRMWMEKMNIK